jgi:hypothetical protein
MLLALQYMTFDLTYRSDDADYLTLQQRIGHPLYE